jgi:hypothetical protein
MTPAQELFRNISLLPTMMSYIRRRRSFARVLRRLRPHVAHFSERILLKTCES